MGFMDKAKKLAEQAQQKLDEAQSQFNQSSSPQGGQQGGGQKFDSHGRPIPEEAPPADAAPPAGGAPPAPDPTAGFGGGPTAPASPEQPPAPTGEEPPAPAAGAPSPEEPAAPPPAPSQPSGDTNVTPDPFKPLQQ
jgi:hypothetical protein